MIKQGDCLELLKEILDDSVDMVLTDLPYNTTACTWDKSAVDLNAMWVHFKRIVKPCSAIVLFASGKFTHKLIASNFEQYKYKWIWIKNKPTMFVHAKNAPMRRYEEICIFSDGAINHASCTNRRMKYNPQGLKKCFVKQRGALKKFGSVVGARPSLVDYYVHEQSNYPSDILIFDAEPNGRRLHPTQKPVDLLEYLIKTYSNEGEVVLDATMGSGSTGVACVNTNRRFIGFELDEKYFEIAQKRIEEALAKKAQELF